MTKEEWKQAFRQMNDREPSVEEFFKAKENGEFEFEETLEDKTENISKPDAVSLKQRFGGKNKQYIILAGSIIFIIALIIGGFSFINNRPKDIINKVEIRFSGYNKKGTATLNGNYKNEIGAIIAKKIGYSSSDVEAVRKGNDSVLTADSKRMSQFYKYMDNTNVSLDKSDNLSNGDNVVLKVNSSLKDSPIKSAKKNFRVSGLKKSNSYTVEDILKKFPIKVSGYNYYGFMEYKEGVYDTSGEDKINLHRLENGDIVKISLLDSYIKLLSERGIFLQGSKTTTIKVSNLKTSVGASNLSEVLSQIDTNVKVQFGGDYIRQSTHYIGESITHFDPNSFSIILIYKQLDSGEPSYFYYGYEGLKLENGKINIDSLNKENNYQSYASYDSADKALSALETSVSTLITN